MTDITTVPKYEVWSTTTRGRVRSFHTSMAAEIICSELANAGDVPLLLIPTERLNWEQGHTRSYDG